MAAAAPAAAQLAGPGGDCETSSGGCGGGGGPAPKPSIPTGSGTLGSYHVYVDPYGDDRDGYVRDGRTTYFGGGPFHAIGGDGTVRDGFAGSRVTLATTVRPAATAAVTAAADPNLSAEAGSGVLYAVELHAANAAAFAALTPLLDTSGAIARISGSYTLATAGQAYAQAYAETGIDLDIAPALQGGPARPATARGISARPARGAARSATRPTSTS